jgi:hypothetical protein
MKAFRLLLVVVFCGALVSSCFDPPEYPDSPEISFESVRYVKGDGATADSIVLVLNFKDGDGDIGVSAEEIAPPFNDRWYYTRQPLQHDGSLTDDCTGYDNSCWYINPVVTEFDKYVDYKDRLTEEYDTLKPFVKPYSCVNWEVVKYDHDDDPNTALVNLDTLFFTLNPHYNNIFVEFQTKTATGYEVFDEQQFFTYPTCGIRIFHGRIPILSENLNDKTPLEGIIRYRIPSVSFQTVFGAKTLRLRVYIEDRALHKSNEVFTRDFTLLEN